MVEGGGQDRRSMLSLRPLLPDRKELERQQRELDRKMADSNRRMEELRQVTMFQERLAAEMRSHEERRRASDERLRESRRLQVQYRLLLTETQGA